MSSIDLTVTSGILHLRRREKTFAEVQLGRPPKLIGGRQRALLGLRRSDGAASVAREVRVNSERRKGCERNPGRTATTPGHGPRRGRSSTPSSATGRV